MNRMRSGPGVATRTGRAVAAGVLAGVLLVGCGSGTPGAPTPAAPDVPSSDPAPTVTAPTATAPTATVPTYAVPTAAARSATVLATTVAVAAPGAGPAADRVAAETVFRTYLRAVADGDFATACSLNAPETNRRLLDELARRGTPASGCEQAIATLYAGAGVAEGAATIADTLQVQRVDVTGDAATVAWSVEVSGQRPLVTNALRRVDGQWRLLPTPNPAG
jgi:hypothetical protein